MRYDYPELAHRVVDHVAMGQRDRVDAAVDLLAPRLLAGGVLHAFGTGHARIPVHEMAGRAGGLIPVNLVRLGDLAARGDRPAQQLQDPLVERDAALAQPLLDVTDPGDDDAFLVASNSGINGAVVELALLVRARGLPLVALTSLRHARAVPSRHASGLRLADVADVVIDNGAPPGDAALDLGDGSRAGAVSNLAGVVAVQMLTEGLARAYLAAGRTPPLYVSMNLPEGDDANGEALAAVAGRVRPIEP